MDYVNVNDNISAAAPPPDDVLRILDLFMPLLAQKYNVYIPVMGMYEHLYRFYPGPDGEIHFIYGTLEAIIGDE